MIIDDRLDWLDDWLSDNPEISKDVVYKTPPWNIYRLNPTGQHCIIHSYSEDGAVSVRVNGHDKKSLDIMYRLSPVNVFGVTLMI